MTDVRFCAQWLRTRAAAALRDQPTNQAPYLALTSAADDLERDAALLKRAADRAARAADRAAQGSLLSGGA